MLIIDTTLCHKIDIRKIIEYISTHNRYYSNIKVLNRDCFILYSYLICFLSISKKDIYTHTHTYAHTFRFLTYHAIYLKRHEWRNIFKPFYDLILDIFEVSHTIFRIWKEATIPYHNVTRHPSVCYIHLFALNSSILLAFYLSVSMQNRRQCTLVFFSFVSSQKSLWHFLTFSTLYLGNVIINLFYFLSLRIDAGTFPFFDFLLYICNKITIIISLSFWILVSYS